MTNYGGSTPTIGARVVTSDGEELGKVKEISGTCFKVDAPMQPDYWLATDCVSTGAGDVVRLTFAKSRLGDVKQDGPDHKGFHPHNN
jgi:hypothetical protein